MTRVAVHEAMEGGSNRAPRSAVLPFSLCLSDPTSSARIAQRHEIRFLESHSE